MVINQCVVYFPKIHLCIIVLCINCFFRCKKRKVSFNKMASTQSMLHHHRLAVITLAVLALLLWSDIAAGTSTTSVVMVQSEAIAEAHTTLKGTNGRCCLIFLSS